MSSLPVLSRPRLALALLLATLPVLSLAVAQTVGPYNEYDARRQANVQDGSQTGIWALDFRFKAPRLLTVEFRAGARRSSGTCGTRSSIAPRNPAPSFRISSW